MNETNSHLPPVQGGNGLFVPITLEEMAKVLKFLEEQVQRIQKWQELHLSFLKNCKTL